MSALLENLRQLLIPGATRKPIPSLDGAYSPNSRLDALAEWAADLPEPDDVCAFGDGLLVASQQQLLQLDQRGEPRGVFAKFDEKITALAALGDGRIALALEGDGLRLLDANADTITHPESTGFNRSCITALCEHADGSIYFTVGSAKHPAGDWVWDLLEGNEQGELWRWNPADGPCERLLQGLAYPNGICPEPDGESLLFTQSWRHSLTRLNLNGGTPGERLHTIIDNMPAYPARITAAAGGGYWLALFAMRTQLVEMVLHDEPFKREMMRCVAPQYWVRPALRSTGSHLEPLQGGGIKKLGIKKPWAPPRSYGLVVRLDEDCVAQQSMHSRVDGRRHGITAVRAVSGHTIIVSKGSDALLTTEASDGE